MIEAVFDDLRRIVLGLLFVVAFGWMAALIFPGSESGKDGGWQQVAKAGSWQQVAQSGEVIPPQP